MLNDSTISPDDDDPNSIGAIERAARRFANLYFTHKQTADALEVTELELIAMRELNQGPPYDLTNYGNVVYRIDDVRQWMYRQQGIEP
jgi:hypothetical protein